MMKAKEVKKKKQIIKDGIVICQMPPQNNTAHWTVIISSQPGDPRTVYLHVGTGRELTDTELLEMSNKLLDTCMI